MCNSANVNECWINPWVGLVGLGKAWSHWATVCKAVRPMLSDRCLSCLSVCDVSVLWPNGWMDQDSTWYGGRPRPRPHSVRWGPSFPQKGHSTHLFSAHVYCGKTAVWIKMPLDTEADLGPGHIVLDADPAARRKGGHPLFSVHVFCGQRAGWIKVLLGKEVGLDPATLS